MKSLANKRRHRGLKTALVFASLVVFSGPAYAGEWEKASDANGVTIYTREIEGTSIVGMRGEAVLDAHASDAVEILLDNSRAHEWMPNVIQKRNLEVFSPDDRTEYSHMRATWPVRNRYFVTKVHVEHFPNKEIKVNFKSTDDTVKENDKVLGIVYPSFLSFTPIEKGLRTKVILEIATDPMGFVPKWLVNSTQKNWPRNFLLGFMKQIAKLGKQTTPKTKS